MNIVSAAALLAVATLAGCASHPTGREETPRSAKVAPAHERPGLGTSWGEQRESFVEAVPFARAAGERPAGQDRLYYNDRDGVNAMLDFLGGQSRRVDGLQACARGFVKLALRRGSGPWMESHESHGRRLVIGDSGERYEMVVRNEGRRALEVVLSVDGLDVIDGRPASLKKRGYLLAPFETLSVEGFRTSNSTVAAFRFGSVFASYGARRHGATDNAGVIGVAVFEEQRRRIPGDSGDGSDRVLRHVDARPAAPGHGFATPPDA